MGHYRKKPVVIEAVQIEANFTIPNTPTWLTEAINAGTVWMQGGEAPYFTIRTLEGHHRAVEGDWIIRGIKGELYPCKPDIFAATYDAAPEAAATYAAA